MRKNVPPGKEGFSQAEMQGNISIKVIFTASETAKAINRSASSLMNVKGTR